MSNEVYIISGSRTAIGSFQGQFDKFPASELGSAVIAETLKRGNLEPKDVEQVIFGNVLTAGLGQNPARQAAVGAKIPYSVPAFTINMLCGSGLRAVSSAYQAIRNNDYDVVVAGGQESMSRAQHTSLIRGSKLGNQQLNDSLLSDGLIDAFHQIHMGLTAEHLAKDNKVSRIVQDQFALNSQLKAQKAIENGYFQKEIVGIPDKRSGKLIDRDEFPKFNSTIEDLTKLRPAFDKSGTVTAGNASGINDGAAALLLCSEKYIKSNANVKPWARVVAFAEVGLDPLNMGLGPVGAVTKLLEKTGWDKDSVDLFELNEAFAVQSVIVADKLQVDPAKLNITGGAVALGHPIGASGARVLVTLLHNLERLSKQRGIAALCVGGGMGIGIAVEIV